MRVITEKEVEVGLETDIWTIIEGERGDKSSSNSRSMSGLRTITNR